MQQQVKEWVRNNPKLFRTLWESGYLLHYTVPAYLPARGRAGRLPLSKLGGLKKFVTGICPEDTTPPHDLVSAVSNPVLSAKDVTDYGKVEFVADPFLFVSEEYGWNMFFEVFNGNRSPTAVIGHARSSDSGRSWKYNQVVLNTGTHISFPYIFQSNTDIYMIPESQDNAIRLYKAYNFPKDWRCISTLINPGFNTGDSIAFQWKDRWWLLSGTNRDLFAYHSESIEGPWNAHSENPILTETSTARPAGSPIVYENKIQLFLQNSSPIYGSEVYTYVLKTLSPNKFEFSCSSKSPLLTGSENLLGWNSGRMHHIDAWNSGEGWVCAVDGNIGFGRSVFSPRHWGIGMYYEEG